MTYRQMKWRVRPELHRGGRSLQPRASLLGHGPIRCAVPPEGVEPSPSAFVALRPILGAAADRYRFVSQSCARVESNHRFFRVVEALFR